LGILPIVLEHFQVLLKEHFSLELPRFLLPVESLATIVSFPEPSREKAEERYEQEIVEFLHSPASRYILDGGG
jgi:hypothetical protein